MHEDQVNELLDAVWTLLDQGFDKADVISTVYNAIDSWTPLENE